jgi:hypothetical protein
MALESKINDAMLSRGFKPFVRIDSSIWFARSRQKHWSDAFCFKLDSHARRVSLSFGIENATIRALALTAAAAISPKAYSEIAAPPFTLLERPSVNMFPASMEDPIVRAAQTKIDEELIDFIERRFFQSIDSNLRYLEFLKGSTGMLEWVRSAAVFRLIYIGYLYRLEGMTSAEFSEFCLSLPKISLEAHILLWKDGWTAEAYVDACIKKIWC